MATLHLPYILHSCRILVRAFSPFITEPIIISMQNPLRSRSSLAPRTVAPSLSAQPSIKVIGLERDDKDEGERKEEEHHDGVPHTLRALNSDAGYNSLDEHDREGLRGELCAQTSASPVGRRRVRARCV